MKYKEDVEKNIGVHGGCMPSEMDWLAGLLQVRGCLEAVGWENK